MRAREIFDWRSAAAVAGVEWRRWYLGVSYETPYPGVRALVFRAGPIYLHLMRHEASS